MGLSHNSYVRMGRGGNVEEVVNIRSVDLVADPATTNGVFESVESSRLAHQVTERTDEDWLRKITCGKTATEQLESEQQGAEWLKRIARPR